jgi:hypothetical protein
MPKELMDYISERSEQRERAFQRALIARWLESKEKDTDSPDLTSQG